MIFSQLAQFTDIALLLLRLMVGMVFIASGSKHLKDPETRSRDIGMSNELDNGDQRLELRDHAGERQVNIFFCMAPSRHRRRRKPDAYSPH